MAGHIKPWTPADVAKLRRLCSGNTLFMKEIAEKLGRSSATVRWKAHKLGVWSKPEGRMAEWNRKHAHLREDVLRYFLTHSFQETADHFGLSQTEMKSCLTYAYIDPRLKKLRKEWRPHSAWTGEDWIFMVRHVGIQPRKWIAKKLKRGTTYNSVKDALAKFRGHGKHMNGMPWGWAQELFGLDAAKYTIKTKAGPTGSNAHRNGNFQYRIIPWVVCERLLDRGETKRILGKGKCKAERKRQAPRIKADPAVISAVRAMAEFQRWIHGTESDLVIVRRIRRILKQR